MEDLFNIEDWNLSIPQRLDIFGDQWYVLPCVLQSSCIKRHLCVYFLSLSQLTMCFIFVSFFDGKGELFGETCEKVTIFLQSRSIYCCFIYTLKVTGQWIPTGISADKNRPTKL